MKNKIDDMGICISCGFSEEKYKKSIDKSILPPGIELEGRYILGSILGRGGFGITYIAWDKVLNVAMAIKEFYPRDYSERNENTLEISTYSKEHEEKFEYYKEKFLNEARILAKFSHDDGIVSVQDIITANNTVYIVMFYIEGITLEEYTINENNRLSIEEVDSIMFRLMESLIVVHEAKLIHRDISPDNIYVTNDGKVKLLDFGAARIFEEAYTQNLSIILKQGYAPIEQYVAQSNQGPWTDIYSIGATYYRLLTGTKPMDSMSRLINDNLKGLIEQGARISPQKEKAIMKALAIKKEDRQSSILELMNDLKGGESKRFSKAKVRISIILVCILCLFVMAFFIYNSNKDSIAHKETPQIQESVSPSTQEVSLEYEKPILEPEDVIEFRDPYFEEYFKNVIGKDVVYYKDINRIKEIKIAGPYISYLIDDTWYGKIVEDAYINSYILDTGENKDVGSIKSLEDLRYFTALYSFTIHSNQDAQVHELSKYLNPKKMLDISIINQQLESLDFLVPFKSLRSIVLRNNNLTDISQLKNFRYLSFLILNDNNISSIEALRDSEYLEVIDLSQTLVRDISPLADKVRIGQFVYFGADNLEDISQIKNYKRIYNLKLSNYRGENLIETASEFKNLKQLWLDNCGLENIEFIEGLPHIYELSLEGNYIDDISSVKVLKKLKHLNVKDNLIKDFSALGDLEDVEKIY